MYVFRTVCNKNDTNTRANMRLMKIFHPIHLEDLWNDAISEHNIKSPNSEGKSKFDDRAEVQVGLM